MQIYGLKIRDFNLFIWEKTNYKVFINSDGYNVRKYITAQT